MAYAKCLAWHQIKSDSFLAFRPALGQDANGLLGKKSARPAIGSRQAGSKALMPCNSLAGQAISLMKKPFPSSSFLYRTCAQRTLLRKAKEAYGRRKRYNHTGWQFVGENFVRGEGKGTNEEVPERKMPELRKKVRKTSSMGKILQFRLPVAGVGQKASTRKGGMRISRRSLENQEERKRYA